MTRARLALAAFAAILLSSTMLAQIAPDDLVITGAGWGSGWDTEIELADSELGTGTAGSVFTVTGLTGPCPPTCDSVAYSVPPKGTVRILLSQALPAFSGLLTLHVTTDTERPLPVVRARIFNGAIPGQSAEIPVFRNPTLAPRSFPVLVFPGLRRQPGTYSNLILQSLGPVRADALVEAFGPDGRLLGSEVVSMPRFSSEPVVLADVASRLGADQVDGGQVRVTNASGQILWGVLATISSDGRLAIVPGANP